MIEGLILLSWFVVALIFYEWGWWRAKKLAHREALQFTDNILSFVAKECDIDKQKMEDTLLRYNVFQIQETLKHIVDSALKDKHDKKVGP